MIDLRYMFFQINHNNEITEQSWLKTAHVSRKCYLVNNGPGTEIDKPGSGLNDDIEKSGFTMEQSEEGYKNFTVINIFIHIWKIFYVFKAFELIENQAVVLGTDLIYITFILREKSRIHFFIY